MACVRRGGRVGRLSDDTPCDVRRWRADVTQLSGQLPQQRRLHVYAERRRPRRQAGTQSLRPRTTDET